MIYLNSYEIGTEFLSDNHDWHEIVTNKREQWKNDRKV